MNTAKLKAVALAATPGEWCPDDHHGVIADAGLNANFYIASCSGPEHKANKRFIAAANPAAVLELIAALEAAEKRIGELECEREALEAVSLAMRDEMRMAGINLETGGEA
ncbi:ead/Ea22-like family protein [Cronobacter sakazakii]